MRTKLVKTKEELDVLERRLMQVPRFTYDTETTGLEWWKTEVFMLSFCDGETAWVVPCKYFEKGQLKAFLEKVTGDQAKEIIGHNIKFDMHQTLQTFDVDFRAKIHDTKVMAHLIDENRSNSLKPLMNDLLNIQITEEAAVKAWLNDHYNKQEDYRYDAVPDELMVPYSGKDAWGTFKLYEHLWPKVQKDFAALYETERQIVRITFEMEHSGIKIDVPYLEGLRGRLHETCEEKKRAAFEVYGKEFDINSADELAKVLYDDLKLPVHKRTKAGERSTEDDVLQMLDHPVASAIQEYRGPFKNLTTYVEPFLAYVDKDHRLHGNFNNTGTRTGRFSASKPNLQNIPRGPLIRRCFITDPGTYQFYFDQSQIEMVGFAHYSQDPNMVEALRAGADLHASTAAEIFGVPLAEVTDEQRKIAKGLNFAIIYGVGKKKLASYLSGYLGRKVQDAEAAEYLTRYKNAKPGVVIFTNKVISTVRARREPWGHFVKNSFGRVRRLDPDKAYVGVNNLIQGWAGDLMKATMVRLHKAGLRLKLNIHDELRIDVKKDVKWLDGLVESIKKDMTDWPEVRVPVKVKAEYTDTNWAEVKKYEPATK